MTRAAEYDVVICGAGIAGLTLAYQLARHDPDFSIGLLDRQERPLPAHTHKVGESTIPPGSTYLGRVLELGDYLSDEHIDKLGLRWFFGDAERPLEERAEVGLRTYPRLLGWNFSRGTIENDLREMVEQLGVDLLEGYTVRNMEIAEGEDDHRIECRDSGGHQFEIRGRWAVDALGRRHMLRRKLGLEKEVDTYGSAVWFRLEPRLTPSDLTEEADASWFGRVEDERLRSTNHFVGDGYWMWMINLSGDATSVGVVAHNDFHSFSDFNTSERVLEWLEDHEPRIAAAVRERERTDFRCMRNFSFNSTKFLSEERWALTGEAASFADPWFSFQMNFIAKGNCFITDAILADLRHGDLGSAKIEAANRHFVDELEMVLDNFETIYHCFENSVTTTATIVWVFANGAYRFGTDRDVFRPGYLTLGGAFEANEDERHQRLGELNATLSKLFREWAEASGGSLSLGAFTDYEEDLPFLDEMRKKAAMHDDAARISTLEALAQSIFLIAIEDTMPEQLERFQGVDWLDAWSISLDSERWEEDGLFEPWTPAGNLERVYTPLRDAFHNDEVSRPRLFA